jgi:hypothetical protein
MKHRGADMLPFRHLIKVLPNACPRCTQHAPLGELLSATKTGPQPCFTSSLCSTASAECCRAQGYGAGAHRKTAQNGLIDQGNNHPAGHLPSQLLPHLADVPIPRGCAPACTDKRQDNRNKQEENVLACAGNPICTYLSLKLALLRDLPHYAHPPPPASAAVLKVQTTKKRIMSPIANWCAA